jgi:type I restriction enzyme M protein
VLFINADAEYFAGRAQNYLLPEHVEKIASTYERFEDIAGYARSVSLDEISDAANDFNLNIRRYVDNSPPPEPHDVRAHLVGGVPVAEVEASRSLFEALGFEPSRAFARRSGDTKYYDFGPAAPDRKAIGPLIERDGGVAARRQALLDALASWWAEHSPRLADLPQTRALNAARAELLKSFTAALTPLAVLDRFKLAGVVATWWTETLPDLKTLIENGFPGVIDGWLDAVADAVLDDDNVGPAFDPFSHKLVRRTMADYLDRIDDAKAEIARLKGEKEAFEQSNPPEDADEEELKTWNFAKDLERQIKDLKSENSEAIKALKKLQKAAAKRGSTDQDRRACAAAEARLKSVFDQMESLGAELEPYEQIKTDLAAARAIYRELVAQFVAELRSRCDALSPDEKQALVMELFDQDLREGLDTAAREKRRFLIRVVENLWDKYARPLTLMQASRENLQKVLAQSLRELGYAS